MQERKIIQVGFVVRDLDRALADFSRILGAGPWEIYRYSPPEMTNITYRGKSSDWSADIAFAWLGDRQLEIIMPLTGPNIYEEFLAKKGDGIHHVKEWVEDPVATVEEYAKKGIGVTLIAPGGPMLLVRNEMYRFRRPDPMSMHLGSVCGGGKMVHGSGSTPTWMEPRPTSPSNPAA